MTENLLRNGSSHDCGAKQTPSITRRKDGDAETLACPSDDVPLSDRETGSALRPQEMQFLQCVDYALHTRRNCLPAPTRLPLLAPTLAHEGDR
jgi:hypothetical protein